MAESGEVDLERLLAKALEYPLWLVFQFEPRDEPAWLLDVDGDVVARLRFRQTGYEDHEIALDPPADLATIGLDDEISRGERAYEVPQHVADDVWRRLFHLSPKLRAEVAQLLDVEPSPPEIGEAIPKASSVRFRGTRFRVPPPRVLEGVEWPLASGVIEIVGAATAMARDRADAVDPLYLFFAACEERRFAAWLSGQSSKFWVPATSARNYETDLTPVSALFAHADDLRRETGTDRLIERPHLLGALLTTREVEKYLGSFKISPRAARRALVALVSEDGEDPVKWQQALLASFDIDHLVSRDTWTVDDKLGYEIYADAITRSILDHRTKPPLTIGIQAPWGHGKTSLMRMIQKRLDPKAPDQEGRVHVTTVRAAVNTTYNQLLAWSRATADGPMLSKEDVPFPTVWFNPLYYRETTQIWAGLAHAMLHQLVGRLDPARRELFWFRLQQSRINVSAIRSDFYHWVLARFVPAGAVWLTFVIVCALAGVVWPQLFFASGGGILAAVTHFFIQREKDASKVIDRPFERYVTEPNYQSELGLLHLIDHDLDGALSLLIGNDEKRSISVFIDDLDRCDPQTVNQVVLAINQFLSLPRRNVFFFLGMDMEMVAAALEQAQKETLGAVAGPAAYRRSYGWRFMEKFIQLPFVIPHLDDKTAAAFAQAHLGRSDADQPARAEELAQAIGAVQRTASAESLATYQIPKTFTPRQRLAVQLEKSKKAAELMQDGDSEEMQRLVELALQNLELNPRTIVRYFCLVRVLRNIQFATESATRRPDYDRLLVVRAAHLLMNWPQFVQWLRNNPRIFAGGTTWKSSVEAMEELAKNASDHQAWAKGLKELLQESKEPAGYLTDVSLYDYLRALTTRQPGLKAMYDARFF